jgi:hypothetical protein
MTTFTKAGAKDFKYLVGRLERAGHKVQMRGSGHYLVKHRDGIGMVTLPSSPGDYRGWQNAKSQLRRAGFGDDV